MMKKRQLNFRLTKWRTILLGLLAGILISITAYFINKSQENKLRQDNEKEFIGIANLKIKEINEWINERIGDVSTLSTTISDVLEEDGKTGGGSESQKTLAYVFNLMQNAHNYEEIQFLSPDGKILFSSDTDKINRNVEPHTITLLERNMEDKNQVYFDLFFCEKHQAVHFEISNAVMDNSGNIVGYALLRMNPENYLYPLVVSWPLPTKTAESLIVKDEGDEVLFLNKLLHNEAAPLSVRISKTRLDVPAVQATLGFRGFFRGLDYRGEKVIALVEPIPDTPWYMIVKIDEKELFDALKKEAFLIYGFASAFFLLVVLGLITVYNSLQREFYKQLVDSQQLFKTTLYSIGDAVIVTNEQGEILNMNKIAEDLTGYSEKEAFLQAAENIFKIENETTGQKVESPIQQVIAQNTIVGLANHTVLVSKNGNKTPIADSGAPINNSAGKLIGVVLVFRDQTAEREAREKLRASEERLKLVSEATEQGVWDWDLIQNKVFYSENWMKQIGYRQGELPHEFSTWEEHLHPDDSERCHQAVNDFVENPEKKFRLEFRFRHKKGNYIWIRNQAEAQLDANGKVLRMYGAHVDITAERQAEEALRMSEKFFRSLFENSPLGKSLTGLDGSLRINRTFSRILGYSQEEFKGKKWQEVTHPDDIDASGSIVQAILGGEKEHATFEKRYIHKDGHFVWTEVNTTLLRDGNGNPQYFITTISDISDRKKNQEILAQSQRELEKLNQELVRSNQELEQFAYVASHDLQEPLRMVSSYTQLLQKRYKDQLDDTANDFIHFAVDGAMRMQGLINDLLDFSRVTTRGKSFSKVSLISALAQARLNLKTKITETSSLIINDELPEVMGDEGQLVRVFQNLIDNAIKYCSNKTPIIQIGASLNEGVVTVNVRDNGIGIDPKFKERVFVIFQRLHSRDKYGGTGIGLAICKRIVERHGGTIWLESEPENGTTFYFTLNLA